MKRQRGYAVAVFLVLLIMGFLASLVSQLGTVDSAAVAERDLRNAAVFQEARNALLAWAANHPQNPGNRITNRCLPVDSPLPPPTPPFCPDRPGALPCPDRNNDGWADEPCDAANQQTGRFPWRTLNAPDLRDDSGERLWYAVSASFRHQTNYPGAFAVNAFTPGNLTLCLNGGGACNPGAGTIATNLAAVIIAPRAALPGQNRTGGNINALAHYLEARNAAPGVLFDTAPSAVNPAFNDSVLPISQTELMDAVIPVVSERLRTTVRPAIMASYDPTYDLMTANSPRWRGLPYPVPFSDPRSASFNGTAVPLPVPREGLMPAHNSTATVRWLSGTESFISGAPVGSSISCAVGGGGALTCSITLNTTTFPTTVTVGALVSDVGRAFVRAYELSSVSSLSNAVLDVPPPPALPAPPLPIQHGFFGPSNVDAQVRVRLRVNANPAQFTLARPDLDPALTDPLLGFGAPTAWFTRNEWHRNVYYAVVPHDPTLPSPPNPPQDWSTPCSAIGCLLITTQDMADGTTAIQNNLNGVMVLMGRTIIPPPPPAAPPLEFNFLELANRPSGGNHVQFVTGPARPNFNDRAVSAHP